MEAVPARCYSAHQGLVGGIYWEMKGQRLGLAFGEKEEQKLPKVNYAYLEEEINSW
jgi:hypothetical protein